MEDYIHISALNDFVFCPYSIYLQGVYMNTDEGQYKASPQIHGKVAHQTTDKKTASNRSDDILSLPVYSEEYGLMGKIDVYKKKEKKLIERKYQLKQIFQGQIYQLWAQMLCLQEMGYEVDTLAFYETSSNKTIPVALPTEQDLLEFKRFLHRFRSFDPSSTPFTINPNKCRHCIYCNLCDKTTQDNVYS